LFAVIDLILYELKNVNVKQKYCITVMRIAIENNRSGMPGHITVMIMGDLWGENT